MKKITPLFVMLLLFISSDIFAQLTVNDQEPSPNTLFQVNDEGSAGSVTLYDTKMSLSGNKIYNYGNDLYWGSKKLGFAGSAAGWTDEGTYVRLTTHTDKVGVGTTSPSATFHVTGSDGVLFEGEFGVGTQLYLGGGTKMMWYPRKAAFRTGQLIDDGVNYWNDNLIGNSSFASGYNTLAKGECSIALGKNSIAEKQTSIAIGYGAIASGFHSRTIGTNSVAEGSYSTALGFQTMAKSVFSTAIGANNLSFGNSTNWIETDPIFEIGIGTSTKRNALTVLKNGKVGIGIATPASLLHISGANTQAQLSTSNDGVFGQSNTSGGSGVAGINTGSGNGIYGRSTNGYAGKFEGDVNVSGDVITKNLKSNTSINIESSTDNITLKAGNTIVTIKPSGEILIQSSADVSILAEANLNLNANGDLNLSANNINIEANSNLTVSSSSDMTLQSDNKLLLDASSDIKLTSDAELLFENDYAFNKMFTNGDIDIQGQEISIKASGKLILKGSNITEN